MKRSTSILVGGLSLAALVAGASAFVRHQHSTREAGLIAACERESNSSSADPFPGKLVCDPTELGSLIADSPHVGVQAEIVAAHEAVQGAEEWNIIAALMAVVSAVPWAWYFLLRRISELRSAVAGNPPAN